MTADTGSGFISCDPSSPSEGATARILAECREEDVAAFHALVYGRVKVWRTHSNDDDDAKWHWSKYAWWKAMWYPSRGEPSHTGSWGVYAGGALGYTGPGDADLTHFMPMPPAPEATKPNCPESPIGAGERADK